MAWYDDPSLVNPDMLPQDDTTGVVPALPAAPVAVRPSPFAAINQQLEQDLQRMQQPRGLQNLPPMGPTYTQEEWAALQQQGQAPEEQPGVLSDVGNLLKRGYASTAQGINWLASKTPGLNAIPDYVIDWQGNADQWKQTADEATKAMSAEQQAADQKKFFNDDYSLGDAWSDPRAYASVIESVPGTIAGMAVGGPITGGLAKLGGAVLPKLGIGLATEAATGVAGAAASKAVPKLTEKAIERLTMGAGAVGYGAGEGLVAAGSAGASVRDWILENAALVEKSSPVFKDLVENKGYSKEQALLEVADTAESQSALRTGLTTAILGAPMGAVFGKWFHGAGGDRIGKSVLGSIGIGAGGEALQEFPQSGFEKFYENQAVQQYADPSRPLDQGVLDAAVKGGLAGAIMGGVMGGGGHYSEGASARGDMKARIDEAKLKMPFLSDDEVAKELKRVTDGDIPNMAKKAAQEYRGLLETEQANRQGDQYLREAAKLVAGEVGKPEADQDPTKIVQALIDPRATRVVDRIAGDLSQYGGDLNELQAYASAQARLAFNNSQREGVTEEEQTAELNRAVGWGSLSVQAGEQAKLREAEKATPTVEPTPPVIEPSLPNQTPPIAPNPPAGLGEVAPVPPVVPSAPVVTDPETMSELRKMTDRQLLSYHLEPGAFDGVGDDFKRLYNFRLDSIAKANPNAQLPPKFEIQSAPVGQPTPPALPEITPPTPSLPGLQSETAPALPEVKHPDPVIVGETPVESVTKGSTQIKQQLAGLAAQVAQDAQSQPAPSQPSTPPAPTPPTPALPDSSPAALGTELAPSQDSALNAPAQNEAGSVAQGAISRLEQEAISVGNDQKKLQSRLNEAKQVLNNDVRGQFKDAVFDYENKRLVSSDGKLALQWTTREKPNEPESYDNQQTSTGSVRLLNLDTAQPTPTPAATGSATQPTPENLNDSRNQEGRQTEALLDQPSPPAQEGAGSKKEPWEMTREQYFDDEAGSRVVRDIQQKYGKTEPQELVSYEYQEPGPAGPWKGKISVKPGTHKKGDIIQTTFGRAVVKSIGKKTSNNDEELKENRFELAKQLHKDAVKQAIADGKIDLIPKEVLADYPDLQGTTPDDFSANYEKFKQEEETRRILRAAKSLSSPETGGKTIKDTVDNWLLSGYTEFTTQKQGSVNRPVLRDPVSGRVQNLAPSVNNESGKEFNAMMTAYGEYAVNEFNRMLGKSGKETQPASPPASPVARGEGEVGEGTGEATAKPIYPNRKLGLSGAQPVKYNERAPTGFAEWAAVALSNMKAGEKIRLTGGKEGTVKSITEKRIAIEWNDGKTLVYGPDTKNWGQFTRDLGDSLVSSSHNRLGNPIFRDKQDPSGDAFDALLRDPAFKYDAELGVFDLSDEYAKEAKPAAPEPAETPSSMNNVVIDEVLGSDYSNNGDSKDVSRAISAVYYALYQSYDNNAKVFSEVNVDDLIKAIDYAKSLGVKVDYTPNKPNSETSSQVWKLTTPAGNRYGAYLSNTGRSTWFSWGKQESSTPEPAPEPTETPAQAAIRDQIAQHFASGQGFKNINEARAFVRNLTGVKAESGTVAVKLVDELIEQAVIQRARQIVKDAKTPQEAYQQLVKLYELQPSLNVRTSTSMEQQAYSTPVPLAFLASQLAGVSLNQKAVVVEPTAGNGALLIESDTEQVLANELNPQRADWLRDQGYETSTQDATQWNPTAANPGQWVDIVIANPPFGTVKSDGKRKIWEVPSSVAPSGKFETGEIDHAIVLKQLSYLKDDGVAVLIVGGVDARDSESKSNKYNAKAKRDFYWTLVNDYNVVNIFTVSGDLYAKQGAGYPIDVIVIRGRGNGTPSYPMPAASLPQVYDSWSALEGLLPNGKETVAANGVPGSDGQSSPERDQPDTKETGTGTAGNAPENTGTVGDRPDLSGQAVSGERDRGSNERPGVSPDSKQSGSAPAADQAGTGSVPADVAGGVATSEPAVTKKPSDYGKSNTVFTEDAAAKARALLKTKLNRPNMGLDPEMVQAGITLAGYHIEAGARSFIEYAKAMVADLGDAARPYLRSWYEAVRYYPGFDAQGMTPAAETDQIEKNLDQYLNPPAQEEAAPAATSPAAAPNKPTKQNAEVASANQAQYEPASEKAMIGTLVPVNMQTAVKSALAALEDRVGPIDAYVAVELGYSDSELGQYFAAEQIDAIALAIDNIANGKGFVIGDQTGIGKGRVNAAVMRWAIKQGKTPIFVTEKPNLYRDMIRDLKDIGMGTGTTDEQQMQSILDQIQMTNSGENIPMDDDALDWYEKSEEAKRNGDKPPKPYGYFLKAPSSQKQQAVLAGIEQSGKLPDAKKIVFTTYAQMQPVRGNPTVRTHMLNAIISDSVLLLDESHNAGGTAQTGANQSFNRAEFVRSLVERASGVFYSSATFAKRPDVMDLYSRTDMRLAVSNINQLGNTIEAGGVPLQQVVSSMLVESGQYLRRERSFEGVEYNTEEAPMDQAVAENIATSMRNILDFSLEVSNAVGVIRTQLTAQAQSMGGTQNTGPVGADSTGFGSVMHNLIAQFLLGLKAQAAVDKALTAIQNGEKPVITVANTMESLINEYADLRGINIGDPIDLTFGDLLERYLEKSRMVREKKPFQPTADPPRRLTDEELGPRGVRLFNQALQEIRAQDWSKIPASPLDYIKGELTKAGYKVGEITGRQGTIDYTGSTPIYRMRGDNERGIPGRIRSIQQFNNGELDVLLLNRAGSTGLSLHASPKAGKDVRRRHMIIAQAEANIDTHMQMLGRVHRTGQVVAPRYSQLVGDIPAEIRPAAVLAKKMASLNANTTSARDSAVTSKDAMDIMNSYGDEAVAAVMFANQDLHARMGDPLALNNAGDGFEPTDAARKVTGRIPILPLHQQAQLYADFENEYRSILETAIALGENKLEAMTLETDAKEVSSNKIFDGVPGERSPFAASAHAVTYDIKRQGRSMTQAEISAELAAFVGVDDLTPALLRQKITDMQRSLWKEASDFIDQEAVKLSETELSSLERRTDAMVANINNVLTSLPPGGSVSILTPNGSVFYGIVIGLERRGTPKNPAANSAWRIKIAVADSMRTLSLPLTRFDVSNNADNGRVAIEPYDPTMVQNAFDNQSGMSRENRVIMEGNLLAAYSQFRRGQIVYFRHHNGELRQGIMMSRGFDLAGALREMASILNTPEEAYRFLAGNDPTLYLSGQHGEVIIQYNRQRGMFSFRVPASRANGGRWFLNDQIRAITGDFVKVGNQMEARFQPAQLRDVVTAIYQFIGENLRGVDGNTAPAPVDPTTQANSTPPTPTRPQPSLTTTPATGLTRNGFVSALKRAFPYLSEAIDKVLARGERGEKGGTVLIDSNDPNEIARVYAEKTGRSFAEALGEIQASMALEDRSAANTQIDSTMGSYSAVARNILARIPGIREVLDYGAGKGRGTMSVQRALDLFGLKTKVESFEPFPENWAGKENGPDYTDNTKIASNSKDAVVNLNVLNVVPKPIRDDIVANIGRILKPGGVAVLSSRRWKGDVDTVKNGVPGDEENSYLVTRKIKGKMETNYQKGIEPDELVAYIKEILPGFEVRKLNGYGASAVVIQKPGGKPVLDDLVKSEKKAKVGSGTAETAEIRSIASKLGSGDRDPQFGFGKKMGDELYFHRQYESDLPAKAQRDIADARDRINGFEYNIVRYNTKTGAIAFFFSPDFDNANEPVNGAGVAVQPDGSTRAIELPKKPDNELIYHHKWQWVKDDYQGFNVVDSINRSIAWQEAANDVGINRKRIGFKGIWRNEAIPQMAAINPNISFSKATGRMQGFFDPRSGLIFAILPNLSARSAPAVFLHETGHGQQREDITRRAVELISQRSTIKGPLRGFLDRVLARLESAGLINKVGMLTDENEAATYIIEQATLEGRQNGFNYVDGKFMDWVDRNIGKPVGDLIRKLVNFIRAAMLRRGFNININKLTVDDLVSFAKIGVERAAEGDVRVVKDSNAIVRAIAMVGKSDNSEPTAAELAEAQRQYDAVVARYKGTTGWMKAPNGQPTKLNERQWIQTRTENFKRWFDGSKVKDENGDPRVVYHGTPFGGFSAFDIKKAGTRGTFDSARAGMYFQEDTDYASGMARDKKETGPSIYPTFLSIKNPLLVFSTELTEPFKVDKMIMDANSGNHDGIIDEFGNFVAFFPNQIKSAISNVGTFGETDDIRYSYAGPSARTADQSLLQQAKVRVDAGEDAETVRKETGWNLWHDGKWRFEIDDSQADFVIPFDQMEIGKEYPLSEILNHPDLFAAYPELGNLKLYRDRFKDKGLLGSFNERQGTLRVAHDRKNDDALSTILHEAQHWIQFKESFGRGGNEFTTDVYLPASVRFLERIYQDRLAALNAIPKQDRAFSVDVEIARTNRLLNDALPKLKSVVSKNKDLAYEIVAKRRESLDLIDFARASRLIAEEESQKTTDRDSYISGVIKNRINEINKKITLLESKYGFFKSHQLDEFQVLRKQLIDFESIVFNLSMARIRTDYSVHNAFLEAHKKIRNELRRLNRKKLNTLVMENIGDAMPGMRFDLYRALAGEVESRDTQARQKLTAQERQDEVPYLKTLIADGIPDEAVIVNRERTEEDDSVASYDSATAPQFSIAPTESLDELQTISETVDEAGGWNTNRDEEKTIIDRLRDVADKSRKAWVKLLTRQQLVELISHIPGVGTLAQAFERTARNLDAMKQELKQLVYPVAERWRDGIVKSRDNGYLLSKIIRAATLHGVDPLGEPPLLVGGATPQQRAELAEKLRWYHLVKQWMKELETKDPTLAQVYKDVRENYDLMADKRYEALMGRVARSGNSLVRTVLDKAEQGVDEAQPEALIAQLRDFKTADAKSYNKVRGALLSVFPSFKAAPKGKAHPAAKPIADARALLNGEDRKLFDAIVADLNEYAEGPFQKTRYYRLFGQADRLVKEAANPQLKGFGRRLAALFDQDPIAFKALRETLVNYLSQPDALLSIREIADPRKPGKTFKKIELIKLEDSQTYQAALASLPKQAQGLFKETLDNAQRRIADHASTVKGFYETARVNGPYAPLSRFGDYQVYAEKADQPLPIYATFENASEQLRAVKALKEEGWTVTVGHNIEDSVVNNAPSGSFIGSLFGMIEETVKSEQEQAILKDDVYQLYLHSLPDMSASKHFVHRKGIPGFSQDALRAYAQLMNQSANAVARLTYSDVLQEQLQDMSKEVKKLGQDPTDENIAFVNQAAPVVSELNNSYNWLMNPSNATWANRLTGLGFFWYLTNFSTSLVNLTQTPLMTFPDLAAKFGSGPAFNTLLKTIKDYGNWKFRRGDKKKAVIEAIGARFDGDMKKMLDHLEKSGAVSRTETVSLADMGDDVAEFQTSKAMVAVNNVKKFFSWPFQKSEVANREIAAIAAYTLARNSDKAKAMSPESAHQYAQDMAYNVVFRTQNDYSNANRAAFMRNDYMRVLFLFKSFAQMMTWRWLRDVHQMFKAKGVDPETGIELKTIARQRVKWMLASSFLFSGAMGLPIYATTMILANMIAAMGSDPDDPWDVETEVNQAIQAMTLALTNDKNSADVLRRLAMTGPVGTLFGIDLSPRVSMDLLRLWARKAPDNKEGEDYGLWMLQQWAGPVVGGMGVGAVKGLSDLGNAWEQRDSTLASRGLETMIPAPLRNTLKTLRYYSEGVTTRRGDKIVDDPTKLDLVRQFIGFTPAEIADQYERNAAVKEVDRDLSQRKKNLMNRYVYALEEQDQEAADSALEAITEFNLKNPQIAISGNTLSQSYRQRQRAKLLSENGLYIPSKGMRARLEEEGY